MNDTNGYRGPWEKLVDIATNQVRVSQQQTMLMEQLLEAVKAQSLLRDASVEEVKKHVSDAVGKGWKDARVWVAVVLIVLSNLVGQGLLHVLPFVSR